MHVLTMKAVMHIPHCSSLKEKRAIKRSLTERIKKRFNVSIAEVECADNTQTLVLGFAVVSSSGAIALSILQKISDFIEAESTAQWVEFESEFL